jgi:hypothetical protein
MPNDEILAARDEHRSSVSQQRRDIIARQAEGELRFRRPDGRLLPEVPPAQRVPGDPVEVLRESHDADGIAIRPRTAMPGWLGEHLNVGYAIDVLHPFANRHRPERAS